MIAPEARTHPAIAISVSESPDLAALGLGDRHLRDAMAQFALQLLAARARLAYGGDLRLDGFTELLRELVARYWRTPANDPHLRCVTDYLAWPVHASMERNELRNTARQFDGIVDLVCLGRDGSHLAFDAIASDRPTPPTEDDWTTGLTFDAPGDGRENRWARPVGRPRPRIQGSDARHCRGGVACA